MAKAVKQPSGNWRVRVLDYTDEAGKKHFRSFTASTKKEAEYLAAQFYLTRKSDKRATTDITLKEAFDRYINSKNAILSPTTIRSYDRMSKNHFKDISGTPLSKLTNEKIQSSINETAKNISPKTVRNIYSFLLVVLKEYAPEMTLRIKLPQKQKHEIYIPTESEIRKILDNTKDTLIGVAVLLASGLGLRVGEIAGLKWDHLDFENNKIYIDQIIVKDNDNRKITKAPKTTSGTRTLSVPDHIMEILSTWKKHSDSEYITGGIAGDAISKRFHRTLAQLNIHSFRFHDLRHYNASVMLALGIPNKYAQERMGHATDNMLKNVYQHIMEEKRKDVDNCMNNYFNSFLKKVDSKVYLK
ncbi:MAG: tyrosine-type recombinase/integrase, partial [Eubacteriales bacterium]